MRGPEARQTAKRKLCVPPAIGSVVVEQPPLRSGVEDELNEGRRSSNLAQLEGCS